MGEWNMQLTKPFLLSGKSPKLVKIYCFPDTKTICLTKVLTFFIYWNHYFPSMFKRSLVHFISRYLNIIEAKVENWIWYAKFPSTCKLIDFNPFHATWSLSIPLGNIRKPRPVTWNGIIKTKLPFNPLSANPTKWSNTLKQFVGCSQRIVWVCLIIL